MKSKKNAFGIGFGVVTFILLLPQLVTATGITVTVPNVSYNQGGSITVTFTCACPFPCGNATGMDDIYLRRLAWDRNYQMGMWYALGNLRSGGAAPTRTTRTFTIPAAATAANDYVITVWNGEDTCSGDSNVFSIQNGASTPAVANVFTSPPPRSTFYNGNPLWLLWSSRDGWGDGVRLTLMCGSRVAGNFGTVNGNTVLWKVGTPRLENTENDYHQCPEDARYYFRIKKLHSEEYSDSGMFTIANPTIHLDGPRGGETFYRNGTLQVRWTTDHLPPGEKVSIVLMYQHLTAPCFGYTPRPSQIEITREGSAGRFDWPIPAVGRIEFPLQDCDPFSCRVKISLVNYPSIHDQGSPVTIDHRR